MDEINETTDNTQDETGTEPTETPGNVLVPEIVEGEAVEDADEVSGEYLPGETGDLIEDAVRFINLTAAKMLIEYALKIGNYLLTHFFNDDIGLAGSKNRYKNTSFTQLCKRPDIALTRQDMGDMVRVAAQVRMFQSIGIDISVFNYTHQRYLAQLSHSEAKLGLVMECLNEMMSSNDLYKRIQEIKKGLPLPDNETPQEKIIGQYSGIMARLMKKAAMPEFLTDRDKLYDLGSETRTQLKQTATQWMVDLEEKSKECQSLIDHLDYIATHPNS
jgi:hypothetical protein